MSQKKVTAQSVEEERARETAQARADLERLAQEQGVKPFDFEEWRAESETDQSAEETRQEVDQFLRMLREWRETPSHRSLG